MKTRFCIALISFRLHQILVQNLFLMKTSSSVEIGLKRPEPCGTLGPYKRSGGSTG